MASSHAYFNLIINYQHFRSEAGGWRPSGESFRFVRADGMLGMVRPWAVLAPAPAARSCERLAWLGLPWRLLLCICVLGFCLLSSLSAFRVPAAAPRWLAFAFCLGLQIWVVLLLMRRALVCTGFAFCIAFWLLAAAPRLCFWFSPLPCFLAFGLLASFFSR